LFVINKFSFALFFAYKGENINEPIGYLLQLFADKDHLDISDFWRIYDSIEIEKECNV
jgi:hypothetical protein